MAVVVAPSTGLAQAAPAHQHPATAQAKPASGMDAKCQAMMAEHEKMMAQTKEADVRLDGLVATMNAATGPSKVDATAAVVSEIVAQRKAMMKMMKSKPMGGMKH